MELGVRERRFEEIRRNIAELEHTEAPDNVCAAFRKVLDDLEKMRLDLDRAARPSRRGDFTQRLIETAQAIILVLDTKGRIVFFNPHMERISGYALQEVEDKDWFDTFLPERDRGLIGGLFRTAVEGTEVRGNVNPIVTKDGTERIIEWHGVTLRDQTGEVTGVLSVGDDITDHVQQEKELRHSEATTETLLRTAVDGVALVDELGTLKAFNPAAEHMFGYPANEAIGVNLCRLIPDLDRSAHGGHLARHFKSERASTLGKPQEAAGQHKDGSTFPLELTVSELPSGETPTRFMVVFRDLSERKRLESELRQAHKLEAVATLASGIAHDFNNLLTGLLGCITLTRNSLDADHPSRAILEEGRKAAIRGAALTRQLLTFSGRREAEVADYDLDELIQGLEKLTRSTLGESIRFKLRLGAPAAHVRGDPAQMEQVLLNLVVNARDAMHDGGDLIIETVLVGLGPQDASPIGLEAGEYVALRVVDDGVGMDRETRERAFEPFFTTKELGKGTGLGLATVWGIVQEAHGRIGIESEVGEGTAFTLHLPIVEPSVRAKIERTETAVREGNEVVLIVEDDPLVRLTLRGFLEPWGYRVLEACDANEAVMFFQQQAQAIDLVISDVMLPGSTGLEIGQELEELRRGTPILFMSAHPRAQLLEGGRIPKGAFLLQKPFLEDALMSELRRAFGTRRPSSPPPGELAHPSDARPTQHGVLLLVEDDAVTRGAMAELLEQAGHRVVAAADGAEALRVVDGGEHVDVMVTDLGLPDMGGGELIAAVRERIPGIPIACISGRSQDTASVRRLADQPRTAFFAKPIDFDALSRVVGKFLPRA